MRTRRPTARAIGAAVSLVRSIGEAYTAATDRTVAMRSAAASACVRPSSLRCSPGARPGSTAPVVGVRPCRTNSTWVGFTAPLAMIGST